MTTPIATSRQHPTRLINAKSPPPQPQKRIARKQNASAPAAPAPFADKEKSLKDAKPTAARAGKKVVRSESLLKVKRPIGVKAKPSRRTYIYNVWKRKPDIRIQQHAPRIGEWAVQSIPSAIRRSRSLKI